MGAHNRICPQCNGVINRTQYRGEALDVESKEVTKHQDQVSIANYLKALTILVVAISIAACSTAPNSRDYLVSCKSACRGQVQHYQDDSIDCSCKAN